MPILVDYEALQQAIADINTVKGKFDEEMQSLTEIVEGTTENDWKGPDAVLFVANTKVKLTKLREEYNEFLTEIMNSINENHDVFKETQMKNINMQG